MLAERKVVTKIEANPLLTAREKERSLVRVAAYCRVSTDSDEQLDSYQAQITYYTDYIAKNPDWRFAGIYADEGITGTKAEKRPEFQRLMRDCKKKKNRYDSDQVRRPIRTKYRRQSELCQTAESAGNRRVL